MVGNIPTATWRRMWVVVPAALAVLCAGCDSEPPPPTEASLLERVRAYCADQDGALKVMDPMVPEVRQMQQRGWWQGSRWWVDVKSLKYDIRKTDSTVYPYRGYAETSRSYYYRYQDDLPWNYYCTAKGIAVFGFRSADQESRCRTADGNEYDERWEFLDEEATWQPDNG